MLCVQRDHDAGELRPLALVDRQDVGQGQLVQIAEIVLDLTPRPSKLTTMSCSIRLIFSITPRSPLNTSRL